MRVDTLVIVPAVTSVMYIIKEGDVLVTAVSQPADAGEGEDRKSHVYNLGLIGRGQWFGERSLLTGAG